MKRRAVLESSHSGVLREGRAFTLIEVLIVVAILGIVAAMAVPGFRRVTEQARADTAAAVLRSIWVAQRVYRLDNGAYAPDLATLVNAGLLEPAIVASTGAFQFGLIEVAAQTFSASADRVHSEAWSGTLTIDQDGHVGGVLNDRGTPSVRPSLVLSGNTP